MDHLVNIKIIVPNPVMLFSLHGRKTHNNSISLIGERACETVSGDVQLRIVVCTYVYVVRAMTGTCLDLEL